MNRWNAKLTACGTRLSNNPNEVCNISRRRSIGPYLLCYIKPSERHVEPMNIWSEIEDLAET